MPRPQVARPRVFHLSAAARAHAKLTCRTPAVVEFIEAEIMDVHWVEAALAYLYVFAGILFVVGSIYFLPGFSAYMEAGCYLYLIGGAIYLTCALFDLEEAAHVGHKFEVCMNVGYLVGSVAFNVATVCYVPEVTERLGEVSAGTYGSAGFVVGSLLFIFACFLNGAHTGDTFSGGSDGSRVAKGLVLATTNSTMFGSCLFLVGSVLYMPEIGCGESTAVIGTWCYLWGSVCFVVAGVLPLVRRHRVELAKPLACKTAGPQGHAACYVLV